jgi:hypothetical protein
MQDLAVMACSKKTVADRSLCLWVAQQYLGGHRVEICSEFFSMAVSAEKVS